MAPAQERLFAGSIPQLYERHMVPLIFDPYALDLAQRLAPLLPKRVLEVAAGTGAATRRLSEALPQDCELVATDLNQPMLDEGRARGTQRPVDWRLADAMQLPFEDASFDAVVCQFGAMFFPDKAHAFGEARRVLRRGGVLLFNVWDAIGVNEFADTVTQAMAQLFPSDPPRFLARLPHGYHDVRQIEADLRQGGFAAEPDISTVPARSRAEAASVPAIAYCQGTPLRAEIEARGSVGLLAATQAATAALADRFGTGVVDGRIQAHVVMARRT